MRVCGQHNTCRLVLPQLLDYCLNYNYNYSTLVACLDYYNSYSTVCVLREGG